jgi:hypothetical protein
MAKDKVLVLDMASYTLRISGTERKSWEKAASRMGADTGHPMSLATFIRIIMNDYCEGKDVV